jgi:hypothetical protein
MEASLTLSKERQLINAATDGKLEEVCNLLNEGANINATDDKGVTALIYAVIQCRQDIVFELLNHTKVDVNHRDIHGNTAIILANYFGKTQIVGYLDEHARMFGIGEEEQFQAQEMLGRMIANPASPPVALSIKYIPNCPILARLGTGAFGDVYLGKDTGLSKQFIVKMIKLAYPDQQAAINEIRKIFQGEISVRPFLFLHGILAVTDTLACFVWHH